MNYSLYKMRFTTPVHFGTSDSALSLYTSNDHFCADTFFSALCHTALTLYGEKGVEELCAAVRQGKLKFSDSMPWRGDDYYLPKPMILADEKQEIPANLRKSMKALQWVPVNAMDEFSKSLHAQSVFDAEKYAESFGVSAEMTKANHPSGEDTLPYQVGVFCFKEDCGLYCIVEAGEDWDKVKFDTLMSALAISGIGGKTTAGYGRFAVMDCIDLLQTQDKQLQWMRHALADAKAPHQMLIASSLPMNDELNAALDGACYSLIRRGGFVQSNSYAPEGRKKKTQYFLGKGSVLKKRYKGDLYSVGIGGSHAVYRYGIAMFMGVRL